MVIRVNGRGGEKVPAPGFPFKRSWGRFLINVVSGGEVTAPITVIQNWNPKR